MFGCCSETLESFGVQGIDVTLRYRIFPQNKKIFMKKAPVVTRPVFCNLSEAD